MLLDDIADYLSSGGVGTVGTNIFKGFMPEEPSVAVAVYETAGFPAEKAIRVSPVGTVAAERPRIQVVSRALEFDYSAARSKSHDAYKLLEGLGDRQINGTRYFLVEALQAPFLMGRDNLGRVLIACNYNVLKELST